MSSISDQDLIAQYLKGDDESLDFLVARYLKPVYGFIYRYVNSAKEAEDITQEVFIRAWKNIKKYDPARSFKTWIFQIAKNASLDFLKKKKTLNFSLFENEEGENTLEQSIADPEPLPPELLERADVGHVLEEALKQISIAQQTVLSLYFKEHFTFQEIADSLDESIDTVKSRYRRALIKLKELLEREEPDIK